MARSTEILIVTGAILTVLGCAGLAIPVFSTQQTTEIAKIGSFRIEAQERRGDDIPPLVSGGVLLIGIIGVAGGLYRRL